MEHTGEELLRVVVTDRSRTVRGLWLACDLEGNVI